MQGVFLSGIAVLALYVPLRGELAAAIRRDESVRRHRDDYSCGAMGELTRAIAAAVHRISPETVMGYQYGGDLQPAIPHGLVWDSRERTDRKERPC